MPFDVLLVDDHKIMRDGIKAILNRSNEFRVIGEADVHHHAPRPHRAKRHRARGPCADRVEHQVVRIGRIGGWIRCVEHVRNAGTMRALAAPTVGFDERHVPAAMGPGEKRCEQPDRAATDDEHARLGQRPRQRARRDTERMQCGGGRLGCLRVAGQFVDANQLLLDGLREGGDHDARGDSRPEILEVLPLPRRSRSGWGRARFASRIRTPTSRR